MEEVNAVRFAVIESLSCSDALVSQQGENRLCSRWSAQPCKLVCEEDVPDTTEFRQLNGLRRAQSIYSDRTSMSYMCQCCHNCHGFGVFVF